MRTRGRSSHGVAVFELGVLDFRMQGGAWTGKRQTYNKMGVKKKENRKKAKKVGGGGGSIFFFKKGVCFFFF